MRNWQKASKLEIAPITQIENQKEIWTKYIEAQNLIISTLENLIVVRVIMIQKSHISRMGNHEANTLQG